MSELQEQLSQLSEKLEEVRETRNNLLRERFELKEERRYLRSQLREAETEERRAYLSSRLASLAQKIDALELRIDQMEKCIEDNADALEAMQEKVAEAKKMTGEKTAREAAGGQTAEQTTDSRGNAATQELLRTVEEIADNLAGLLGKAMNYMEETVEAIDLEQVGTMVSDAAARTAQAAERAVKNFEQTCRQAAGRQKENRVQDDGKSADKLSDCSIAGFGVIDGGVYRRVTVSGAGRVNGKLRCRSLRSAGSLKLEGETACAGTLQSSGSLQCTGKLSTEKLQISGAAKVDGDLEAKTVHVPGTLRVGGSLRAVDVKVNGGLRVDGDCEAESLSTTGILHVAGDINAERVAIRLGLAGSRAGTIGGGRITVEKPAAPALLQDVLRAEYGRLICNSVEGDYVRLEGVQADLVRGSEVWIGPGCRIGQVEYTQVCTIDPAAHVNSCEKR